MLYFYKAWMLLKETNNPRSKREKISPQMGGQQDLGVPFPLTPFLVLFEEPV
jgi:hypothetical protein